MANILFAVICELRAYAAALLAAGVLGILLVFIDGVGYAIFGPKDKDIVRRPVEPVAPVAREPDPAVTRLKAELKGQFAVEEALR
jgi:hypothetical protein